MKTAKIESSDSPESLNELELPDGWNLLTVGEISSAIQYGYTESAIQKKDGPRFLRITDIQGGRVNWDTVPSCEISKNDHQKFELKTGDIVFARTGATTGKSFLIQSCPDAVFASYLIRIRPNEKVVPKFLHLFFQTPAYWQMISENVAGIAQPNCNASKLKNLPIPLPSLAEQQRIVARVEALLTHINAAHDRLSRVPLIMKKFRQAVLAAACSGRLTEEWREKNPDVEPADDALLRCIEITTTQKSSRKIRRRGTVGMPEIDLPEDLPNTWTIKKIKEFVEIGVVTDYQDGNHGELYPRTSDFGENGIKFLTATQVFDNEVRLSEAPLLKKEKASQLRIGFAKPRDVLLTHNATVGRVALMPDNCGEIILGTSVTYYRLNPEFIDPNYCCYTMQGQFWQSQLWAIMEQTTRNQVSITKQAEFYFPLPPLAEQHEIVRRVGLLFERADAFDQKVAAASRRCERLTQAVLGKAFKGYLL